MTVGLLTQVLLGGLASGAVLGLIALGFTLVAGTVRVLHFAHGDITIAAVFVGVLAVLGSSPIAVAPSALVSILLVLLIIAAGAVLSAVVAAIVVLPHLPDPRTERRSGGDAVGWIAGGLAVALLLRESLGLALPQQAYAIPDPLRLDSLTRVVGGNDNGLVHLPTGGTVPVRVLAVLVIGLAVGIAAERFLVRSRFGRSLRAVADDPEGAALCGVSARRVVIWAFVVAGLLAGLAGVLIAPDRSVAVDDGAVLGLEAAAAAFLGGIGSLRGALVAGLAVGVVQALAVQALGAGFYDIAPLVLLVAVLAVRGGRLPTGAERRVQQ